MPTIVATRGVNFGDTEGTIRTRTFGYRPSVANPEIDAISVARLTWRVVQLSHQNR